LVVPYSGTNYDSLDQAAAAQGMLETIEIPVATLPIKLITAPCCALIVLAVLWWAIPKFRLYLRILTLGFMVYVIIFSPTVIAALICINLLATPPAVLSAGGVVAGGGPISARKTIAWSEVERVVCLLSRKNSIK
jgi:hypothetical protein